MAPNDDLLASVECHHEAGGAKLAILSKSFQLAREQGGGRGARPDFIFIPPPQETIMRERKEAEDGKEEEAKE